MNNQVNTFWRCGYHSGEHGFTRVLLQCADFDSLGSVPRTHLVESHYSTSCSYVFIFIFYIVLAMIYILTALMLIPAINTKPYAFYNLHSRVKSGTT